MSRPFAQVETLASIVCVAERDPSGDVECKWDGQDDSFRSTGHDRGSKQAVSTLLLWSCGPLL
jgi:hypothetical protein